MAANPNSVRSPLAVTFGVWKALFLREAVYRIAQDRIAWLWLVIEPVSHVALMMWVFTGFNHVVIAGADTALFITLGVLGFFLPRNVLTSAMEAIPRNAMLFSYRQIKPVDTVLVRAALEGFVETFILLLVLTGLAILGYDVVPASPLAAIQAVVVMWLFGLGMGLVVSVAGQLVPEIARAARLLINPLYFLSAMFYPADVLPHALRQVLMLNPLVHGIESLRLAFMPHYRVPPGLDLGYPLACAVVLIFIGLALHVRYQPQLIAK